MLESRAFRLLLRLGLPAVAAWRLSTAAALLY
jgi:hypothetical protein